MLVEGDDISDGFFVTVIVTDDELQFDVHMGVLLGFEWPMNNIGHLIGVLRFPPASPCSLQLIAFAPTWGDRKQYLPYIASLILYAVRLCSFGKRRTQDNPDDLRACLRSRLPMSSPMGPTSYGTQRPTTRENSLGSSASATGRGSRTCKRGVLLSRSLPVHGPTFAAGWPT